MGMGRVLMALNPFIACAVPGSQACLVALTLMSAKQ